MNSSRMPRPKPWSASTACVHGCATYCRIKRAVRQRVESELRLEVMLQTTRCRPGSVESREVDLTMGSVGFNGWTSPLPLGRLGKNTCQPHPPSFIGWAHNHFNNLHFRNPSETKNTTGTGNRIVTEL